MTKELSLNGEVFIEDDGRMLEIPDDLVVRFTSDEVGETMSVQASNIMIVFPFEQVQVLMDEVRNG